MNIHLLVVFVSTCLTYGNGESFLSKLVNRGRQDLPEEDGDGNVCETVRIMPRIALAVVGGSSLKSEISAPYIVAIGERLANRSIAWFCGGSLLSGTDVLTAAHCLISRNASVVRVGSFSTKEKQSETDYEISRVIIHPDYKITESYNDIALIKLKNKIKFNQYIKPVCLPLNDVNKYDGERAKVIGWGAQEFGGEGTDYLRQVEVEVYTNADCQSAYSNSSIAPKTFPSGISKKQLCAGSSHGGKDACQGDSGGPLVLRDSNGIVRQIGIVSTGAGCGFKMYPGVYTRVSSYGQWIADQMAKTSQNSSQNSNKAESKTSQKPNQNSDKTEPKTSQDSTQQSSNKAESNASQDSSKSWNKAEPKTSPDLSQSSDKAESKTSSDSSQNLDRTKSKMKKVGKGGGGSAKN